MSELQIKTITLGELQTNCYIAWCNKTKAAVVIDPADSAEVITEFLVAEKLDLTAILLTHGHFDHCLGLLELTLNFGVPSYLNPEDLFLIKGAQKSAEHWLKHRVDPVPPPTNTLHAGDEVIFGECMLQVIETPGHTPGSVCFVSTPTKSDAPSKDAAPKPLTFVDGLQVVPGSDVIFTGDTLFKDTFPRTDFRYSSVLDLHNSWEKLKKLASQTTILPGHGEITRLGSTAVHTR